MKTRIEGLVQLNNGEAIYGVVIKHWRWIDIVGTAALKNKAIGISRDGKQSPMEGMIHIPRGNVLYIEEAVLRAMAQGANE